MRTLGRFTLAALAGALIGGGLLWFRSGDISVVRPIDSSFDQSSNPAAAAAPTMVPPETLAAVFTPCAHCHEIGPGARTMTGPPLTGILGRKAGSVPHYPYSEALRNSGITWDEATLARFIADPQATVPGTRMIFGGLPQKDVSALVSFIATAGQTEAETAAPPHVPPTNAASAANGAPAAPALPASTLAIGGPFSLVDTRGNRVTQADLLGKPSALFFGYTNCPDVCPTTLLDLTRILKEMGTDADKLNVVFITVDPARDTPNQLANYLSSFDPRIRGFTGTDAEIAAAAKAYQVYYQRVPSSGGGYSMDHTASVFLMDAKGGFVGTLSYEEDEKTSLAKLERLVKAAS